MQRSLIAGGILGLLFLSINPHVASAQSGSRKLELGAQFGLIRQTRINAGFFPAPTRWDPGFGGRVTYDLNRYFSLEGELNFFPREDDFLRLGRKSQGLFGIKAGRRMDRFGVFGKLRQGFMRYGRVFDCPGTDGSSCDEFAFFEYSLDLGGVIEFYPTPRTVLRVDVGDTIIRHRDTRDFPFFPEFPNTPRTLEGGTRQSLQINVGIGVRF